MVVSDSCLAIQSVPQPDYLTDGVHGLEVQQIGQDLCLLTRQFCDARRSRFLVAAMLEEVAYLLLQSGHRKIGVATADVLNTLHQRQLTTPVQDGDGVLCPICADMKVLLGGWEKWSK